MNKIAVRPKENTFGKDLGLLSEVVVTGRKIGTVEELRNFFGKLAHDKLLFRREMDRVLSCNEYLTEFEQMAGSILGSDKVIGYRDATNVWGITTPEVEPIMPFSEEVLRQCVEENKRGSDWRLIYINGFSLLKQAEIRGKDCKNQPCFASGSWWIETEGTGAIQSVESGYRLLNFKKNFSDMTWQSQEDEIARLDERFERSEEQIIAEACFSNFIINRKRLMRNWAHRGRFHVSGGGRIGIGHFSRKGLNINSYLDISRLRCVGVVLSLKP